MLKAVENFVLLASIFHENPLELHPLSPQLYGPSPGGSENADWLQWLRPASSGSVARRSCPAMAATLLPCHSFPRTLRKHHRLVYTVASERNAMLRVEPMWLVTVRNLAALWGLLARAQGHSEPNPFHPKPRPKGAAEGTPPGSRS